MLQLQLQIFAICLTLFCFVLFIFFCVSFFHIFIFAHLPCCCPKQMLLATDFHYTHTCNPQLPLSSHPHTPSPYQRAVSRTNYAPFKTPFVSRCLLFRIIGNGDWLLLLNGLGGVRGIVGGGDRVLVKICHSICYTFLGQFFIACYISHPAHSIRCLPTAVDYRTSHDLHTHTSTPHKTKPLRLLLLLRMCR